MVGMQLGGGDRETLSAWVRQGTAQARTVQRARILLALDEGSSQDRTAEKLGVHRSLVQRTLKRYEEGGLAAIPTDRPRSGRPKEISAEQESAVLAFTRFMTPEGATHWSVRSMARVSGVSPASVQRIWAKHGIKPHLIRTFKLSKDPRF